MAKKATYGNESIKSLRGADRVRKRPAVIFGSDGLEGCEHSIFEIMSNSIDEAREGRGNRIVVTRYLDGSYEVQDFGSGIPVDYNKNEQRENWELLFCEMYAGSKYDNAGGAGSYEFSLGLNGLGLCATQYASEYMDAEIHRDGYCYTLHFEKGENISGRMLTIISRMSDLRNNGTPDMEFAVSGLLARSQLANGQPSDARRTIEVLRECFAERGLTRFLPNMDAMLCRIDMHTGDLDAADAWYREKAPREPTHLNVMRRYQYLTQAMVELEDGRPDTVQLTLAPLEPYVQNCARIIDGIHLNVLTAIALYRKKDERWRERLTAALDAAAEYRFIRTVSVYGTAVLPLLEVLDWDGDKAWRKRLMAAVRTQAAFYPHFLEPRLAPGEELTPTELQILHLLCADKSNAEIAQIMDVKLPTVKTHVSHILDKLDVKRRAEAKAAAKKLRLIPDDL